MLNRGAGGDGIRFLGPGGTTMGPLSCASPGDIHVGTWEGAPPSRAPTPLRPRCAQPDTSMENTGQGVPGGFGVMWGGPMGWG